MEYNSRILYCTGSRSSYSYRCTSSCNLCGQYARNYHWYANFASFLCEFPKWSIWAVMSFLLKPIHEEVRVEFGLVASLGGRHHWEALPSRLFHHLFHTTYSNCTAIYCTILLFEYALITIRETASFSKGCSRVCLLGLHAATSPWAACTRTVVQLVHL